MELPFVSKLCEALRFLKPLTPFVAHIQRSNSPIRFVTLKIRTAVGSLELLK